MKQKVDLPGIGKTKFRFIFKRFYETWFKKKSGLAKKILIHNLFQPILCLWQKVSEISLFYLFSHLKFMKSFPICHRFLKFIYSKAATNNFKNHPLWQLTQTYWFNLISNWNGNCSLSNPKWVHNVFWHLTSQNIWTLLKLDKNEKFLIFQLILLEQNYFFSNNGSICRKKIITDLWNSKMHFVVGLWLIGS